MKTAIAIILIFIATPSVCLGQIYKWVDEQGKTHYTDDPAKVPADQASSKKITLPKLPDMLQTLRDGDEEAGRIEQMNRDASFAKEKLEWTLRGFDTNKMAIQEERYQRLRILQNEEWRKEREREDNLLIDAAKKLPSQKSN